LVVDLKDKIYSLFITGSGVDYFSSVTCF